jgi:hypothetical protein
MANKFVNENNVKSLKGLFYKRANYTRRVRSEQDANRVKVGGPDDRQNLVDYHLGEFILFGKVDSLSIPTMPRRDFIQTFKTGVSADDKTTVSAINFVASQYEKLFDACVAQQQIGKVQRDRSLGTPRIQRAYSSPQDAYNKHISGIANVLSNHIRSNNIEILNFDDFLNTLMSLLSKSASDVPFTLPGFVKSKYYSCTNSGLVLEISMDLTNDDENKVDNYFESRNWNLWLSMCNQYGFAVDANLPWRIMADLDSKPMRAAMLSVGIGDKSDMFAKQFNQAPQNYVFRQFASQLLGLYNKVRRKQVITAKNNKNNKLQNHVENSKEYTLDSFQRAYPASFLIGKYCDIRFLEEERKFSKTKQEQLKRECIDTFRGISGSRAIGNFEIILNKTFDYRGSAGYIMKASAEIAERVQSERDPNREIEREILRKKQ